MSETLDGIINVNKEAGYTSFDVIAKLRGILKTRKMGHAGTLDPAATGVLVVCIGRATKLCEFMLEKEKTYEAVILPGTETDTEDMTGKILKTGGRKITKEELLRAAEHFTGPYEQMPPMYSAIQVDGKRLYDLARKGIEVERTKRPVEIYENTVISVITDEEGYVAEATLRVRCSKGTYIRSLLRDMGDWLGCGACMKALKRTAAGVFTLDRALTLSEIEEARDAGNLSKVIVPIDTMLSKYRSITVSKEWERFLYNGNALEKKMLTTGIVPEDFEGFRVYDSNREFLGFYRYVKAKKCFVAEKMFLP